MIGDQKLGSEFYRREPTKPLFNEHEILTVKHLHHYHVLLDTFKILKTHTPISMFTLFTVSKRKSTLLINPPHSQSYLHCASSLWNIFRGTEQGKEVSDFSESLGLVKSRLRSLILCRQKIGDSDEWDPENFMLG